MRIPAGSCSKYTHFAMPDSPLSSDDVRKVARLSKLAIPEDEIPAWQERLGAVLGYVEQLSELNLDGVEPMAHVGDTDNRLADDEVGAGLPNETLMKLAPRSHPPFLRVPGVLGDGGGV